MARGLVQKCFSCQSFLERRSNPPESLVVDESSIQDMTFWFHWNSGKKTPEKNTLGAATTWTNGHGRRLISRPASRTAAASRALSSCAARTSGATASSLISGLAGREDFALYALIAIVPIGSIDPSTSWWVLSAKNSDIQGKYRFSMLEIRNCSGFGRYSRQSARRCQAPHPCLASPLAVPRIFCRSVEHCYDNTEPTNPSLSGSPSTPPIINRASPGRARQVRGAWPAPTSVPTHRGTHRGAGVKRRLSSPQA